MTAAFSVALHRDPIPSDAVRVTRLAPWIRPNRGDRYWHRPRSAFRLRGRLVVDYWCGMASPRTAESRLADAPTAGALRCATCVGRERGYRRRAGLVFRPRDHFTLPKVCPAPFGDRFCLCRREAPLVGRLHDPSREARARPAARGAVPPVARATAGATGGASA